MGSARQTTVSISQRPALILMLVAVCIAGLCGCTATGDDARGNLDIVLVLDSSFSLQDSGLQVDGKEVLFVDYVKNLARDIIKARPDDRIGIIGFAVQPFRVSPITDDHEHALEKLGAMKTDLGTAIGSAIEAATEMRDESDAPNRIMIIITDGGHNNVGIPPRAAAKKARMKNIRVYTVKVTATPLLDPQDIARDPLFEIAEPPGGTFSQADGSPDALADFLTEIDLLGK